MLELSRELRLSDVVDFTGRIPDEDLLRYLSTADVCLSPDPLNPLNDVSTMNKIMEYMAMARPIVSFELREARVSAGDAAVYAPANDESEFAKRISYLLDDPDIRRQMGELGRDRVAGALSWEHSKTSLIAAYNAAMSKAQPSTGDTGTERELASPAQRIWRFLRSRVSNRSSETTAR
jgi:glycosyltransferase involved in cell wall biosynthesis